MKKLLFTLLATALCLVSCNKEEASEAEKVSQLTFDNKKYELLDTYCTCSKDIGNYSVSASIQLSDGYSSVFMVMFDKNVIGKTINQIKGSTNPFYFRMNGILPYNGDVINGGDIFVSNMDGRFESSFKNVDVDITRQDGVIYVKIDGTLNIGAKITFQTYMNESEIYMY